MERKTDKRKLCRLTDKGLIELARLGGIEDRFIIDEKQEP